MGFNAPSEFIELFRQKGSPIENPRNYDFNSSTGYYWIAQSDGNIILTSVSDVPISYVQVSFGEFMRIITDFIAVNMIPIDTEWYKSLQVGDEVKINERVGLGSQYPCNFTLEMSRLKGFTFKIIRIDSLSNTYDRVRFWNEDYHKYYLDGEAAGYTWHSSMFVPETIASVKINLAKVNIAKLFK